MAGRKLTVVISQAPGKNPVKRQLEDEIATQLMLGNDAEVSVTPHLYDLPRDHHAFLWLRGIPGDMIILGWLYPRALRWTLDRNDIRGREGISLLKSEEEDDDDLESTEPAAPTGIGSVNPPNRRIYVLDLRQHTDPNIYLDEIRRISNEAAVPVVSLGGLNFTTPASPPLAVSRSPGTPINLTAPPVPVSPFVKPGSEPVPVPAADLRRRWYPVIDYSRCTNCMECLDFCLFGVYGVDSLDRILVEEQDNCKRGCPACSRVCPANAIIFPEHKTPSIAGAPTAAAGDFKIDLSKLFGAPSALEIAAMERDTELVADGRDAVGLTVGIPKRQTQAADKPRDDLDNLMDQLDDLDL